MTCTLDGRAVNYTAETEFVVETKEIATGRWTRWFGNRGNLPQAVAMFNCCNTDPNRFEKRLVRRDDAKPQRVLA